MISHMQRWMRLRCLLYPVTLVTSVMLVVSVMFVAPTDVTAAMIDLAMLEPNPGAKLSDGCEAVSQLSVRLPP